MVIALSAMGVQFSHLSVSGSAVEEGEMPMRQLDNRYVSYLSLSPGTFTLNGTDSRGNAVALGIDDYGKVSADGVAVTVDTSIVVKMTYDVSDSSLQIKPISSLSLKGTVVPDETCLDYVGKGVWRGSVNLSGETVDEYLNRYFYFVFNNDDNQAVRPIPGTFRVATSDNKISGLENIRINRGVYDITLDMSDYTYAIDSPVDEERISVFGSSVANGQGAELMHGYAYLLGEQLRTRYADGESPNGFYTSGVSIGGNNTANLLDRYPDVLNDFGRYVIIGLSLGNEGIHESTNQEAIFNGFVTNMLTLINKLRSDGKIPVVVNNYTRGDYNESDYGCVKKMNLLIHGWDVPSINSLGAIDDGTGKWSVGYIADVAHPNTQGHKEFMCAFVPSLFDAILAGKSHPRRDTSQQIELKENMTLVITPEGTLHPFTLCFRVKVTGACRLLNFAHETGSLTGTGSLWLNGDGTVTYNSPRNGSVTASESAVNDGDWHDIALSHYYARGYTALYIDGKEVAHVHENINLNGGFTVAGSKDFGSSVCVSEIALWRAGMNEDEMRAHHDGEMLKSSLEIYSPMKLDNNGKIVNFAQSLNEIKVSGISTANTLTGRGVGDAALTTSTDGSAMHFINRIHVYDNH